ncbi:MAG: hypothetical protein U0744_10610 [Gemmataceae bacterium]
MPRRTFLSLLICLVASLSAFADAPKQRRLLYVVEPGIRNYLEFGGAGILIYDIDAGHKFVKRIETPASKLKFPENIKGVCASVATKRLYFTTLSTLYCLDLVTEKTLWQKALPGGCDRMSITPDGSILYVLSLEKTHWHIVDAKTGDIVKTLEAKPRAHNTVGSLDGTRMYLGCIGSDMLQVADTKKHAIVAEVGPFGGGIRPFTIDAAQKRAYVCVNGLLGFEVGDIATGKKLHRVEVEGVKPGTPKRHGCPSHGVGLTPDESEVWVCDAANRQMHVFDNRVAPPKQIASIKLREEPGWITFTRNGDFAYPSTLDVIDVKTRKIGTSLTDETSREAHSEKVIEIILDADGNIIAVGDQFGVGRKH